MCDNDEITGIILSGGLSRRMGQHKAFMKINDKTLIQLVKDKSVNQVNHLILNSNEEIEKYKEIFGTKVLKDCIPGNLGPLVGVLTGLKWVLKNSQSRWLATFPVDSPFFPENLVSKFMEESHGKEILIAKRDERIHPVFAMWKVSKKLELELEKSLKNEERKIMDFTKKFKTRLVKFPDIGYDSFFNVNTPEDLKKAERIFQITNINK